MELVGFTLQIGCVVRRRGEESVGRSIATRRVALLLADFLLTEHFLSVLNETRVDSHFVDSLNLVDFKTSESKAKEVQTGPILKLESSW